MKENLTMTSEQNKAIVRRFWKAFEANDQAALREVLAPEMVAQSPSAPGPSNREMHLQGIGMFNAAFSDRHFTNDDLIAEGDTVATGLTIERIQDGKIVERWFSFDAARVMRELGLVTPPQANR